MVCNEDEKYVVWIPNTAPPTGQPEPSSHRAEDPTGHTEPSSLRAEDKVIARTDAP